ncbi:cAMP-binding protein [Paramagnetospirillum marisnigri]|uniref:cAMP-binding protein n=1 Tax=Paramagnetospirillum marisnigri TaxID=1285242 RepID=A0A178MBT7_9PROT|nr:cyclic nucleotide-binding domain-containing protein [Paramagnetospirillum marisnigri]OAN45617.1 cAMP-binding protein [Paramagnetospirillum marisnigri]
MDNVARRVVFPAGTVIFSEGEPGTTAYVVESGKVEVYKTVADKTIPIGRIDQGGIFGEMALIDDHPRMASAKALEETACVIIGKERLFQQMDKAPRGVRVIVNALLGNIRAMGTELAEASVILARDKD